jgi:hypothetical protein
MSEDGTAATGKSFDKKSANEASVKLDQTVKTH